MPPKPKITRDMIVDAAYELVRAEGADKLTARSVSAKLGCSTQPILYYYSTVDEIRSAVYEKADSFHSYYIMPKGSMENPLMELGMNYVRFGYEEKNLFKLLFQSDKFHGMRMMDLMSSAELSDILRLVSETANIGMDKAREVFLTLFITAHGYASLLAGNAMEFEEETVKKVLGRAFGNISCTEDR